VSNLSACLAAAIIAVVATVELADPTMPPTHAGVGAAAPALRLQGIVRAQDRLFAVIDGRHVVPGDRVGVWRVVEIRRDAVQLRDGSRELELRLAPEIRREVTPRGGQP
jgi:hypothetical protein